MHKLIFILLLIASCTDIDQQDKFIKNQDMATNICIDRGGIPIYDKWTGNLVDCKKIK